MKKLLITALLTICLTSTAYAAPAFKSYYDYASGLNSGLQISFSTSMVKNYNRSNKSYKGLIDKYDHLFSKYGWFQNLKLRYAFQVEEISKYNLLLNKVEAKVTLVSTSYVNTNGVITTRGTISETSNTVVVEETVDNNVTEYAVVTKTFSTPIKKQAWENVNAITLYSDGTKGSTNTTKTTSITNTVETETKVERTVIRTYALVVEPVVVVEEVVAEVEVVEEVVEVVEVVEEDKPVVVVITEAEYLARNDVTYTDTETYRNAVWAMNSRINQTYTDTVLSKHYGNHLETIGAPAAWSRGYTGKGSTIAILDTGIDMDHTEFKDSIKGTKCFTRSCRLGIETIDDLNKYSHGTHVAGIAAANLDGVGTTGVAYDADLLIAKTAYDAGSFDFTVVDEAIEWAVENGADVINMSANYNFDNTYKNSITKMSDGMFMSTDTRGRNGITFDKFGYAGLLDSQHYYKNIVNAMKGHEAVLVMSAGNQGTDVVGQPGFIALDAEVGDRVLLVGNYDTRLGKIDRSSNKAGTMCFDVVAGTNTCASDARISDRYLMAPGRYVASTDNNGEYRTNSGTSQAAPMVSGAVAIVHQMWPHMTGANLSKLLLNTASKDIVGYDVNVHGQGLLDLNEATLPQGAIGLPTTGRVTGGKVDVSNSGTIAVQGGSISSLTSVMVVDAYDRDYYFDANSMVQVNDTRTTSPVEAAKSGFAPDYYIGFSGGTVIPTGNGSTFLSINETNNNISLLQTYDKFSLGLVNESDTYLGNYANSSLMKVDGSNTAYIGYNESIDMGDGLKFYGSATIGATKLDVDNSSMLKSADIMMSNSATLGFSQTINTRSTFGFVTSMPVSITSGKAHFNLPTSVSTNGDINSSNMSSSLEAPKREVDFGLFYNYNPTENTAFTANIELRTNYAGTSENMGTAGVSYKVMF